MRAPEYTRGDLWFHIFIAFVVGVWATGAIQDCVWSSNYEYAPLLTPWVAP